MEENSLLLKINNKKYFIKDISISDTGEVSYGLCSESKISDSEKDDIDTFVKKLISGQLTLKG